jgi:ABC-type Na+ efflux pump permease subunit
MKTSGGLAEPIIKVVIYGAVAGILVFLWSILGLSVVKAGILGGAIGAMALVWYIVAAIVGLFVGAVILLIISSICKGNTDFETNVRVIAAVMVVMPVTALLGFTMGINLYLSTILSLCVSLYALYLIYNGLIETLKATPQTTKVTIYVLAALLVLFTLMGLSATRRLKKMMGNEDLKELIKDAQKSEQTK